jgi:predicted transposase YdaD
MSKPFDAILKVLVETGPEGWPRVLGLPVGPATVIDADVSTVSGAADKVLRVETDPPYLLHLDFFAGHDTARAPTKLRWYNAVLDHRHDVPVQSVAVLLRPEADSPRLSGELVRGFPDQPPHVVFRYGVLRVWRQPPETFLTGSLGLLPLAPVSAASEQQLPNVIEQMKRRLSHRGARPLAGELWAATWVLLGLRYSEELAHHLLRGITAMEESVTYQAIIRKGEAKGRAEGRVEGARETLVRVGTKQFGGPPDAATLATVNAINDAERLEQLAERVLDVRSWPELLPPPARPGRGRGRRPSAP